MKEFIIENYKWIIELCFLIASLVILILKKMNVKLLDTPFEKLITILPSIIISAESKFKVGSEKKSYVLGVALAYLSDLTSKKVEELAPVYSDRISEAIEKILATPEKKGD